MNIVKVLPPSPIELAESVLIEGDARVVLSRLPSESVQCVVTSPPYWGLRDYGIGGQIGLESTLSGFIQALTSVFEEVRRVLKRDGILWLNIGDGFTSGNRGWRAPDKKNPNRAMSVRPDNPPGLKDKDLLGVPWRLAFALQDAGWYLRSDLIWHKPNAMPESVKDRPTRAHEYLFMLTKEQNYQYFSDAVMERTETGGLRNRRSVWNINTAASNGAHIAGFPEDLVRPCILAATRQGETVLDPFCGAGTVGLVSRKLNRKFAGIELNPDYVREAERLLTETETLPLNGEKNPEAKNGHALTLLESASERRGSVAPDPEAVFARRARKRNSSSRPHHTKY